MIKAPREPGDYKGRDLDCQEAIEPAFLKHAYGVKRHEELTPLPTSGIDPLHWLDVSLGSSAAPA
ncbi:MAG: hypothetical protein KDE63_12790, partial [Novosphingobium sp.]|nr:hypothetical protein [Novosphingobium sp.]